MGASSVDPAKRTSMGVTLAGSSPDSIHFLRRVRAHPGQPCLAQWTRQCRYHILMILILVCVKNWSSPLSGGVDSCAIYIRWLSGSPDQSKYRYEASNCASFYSSAEIFRSGGFVQKYWSVTAARYCYVLSSHVPWVQCLLRENQMVH